MTLQPEAAHYFRVSNDGCGRGIVTRNGGWVRGTKRLNKSRSVVRAH